jgi:hypothetical protein
MMEAVMKLAYKVLEVELHTLLASALGGGD